MRCHMNKCRCICLEAYVWGRKRSGGIGGWLCRDFFVLFQVFVMYPLFSVNYLIRAPPMSFWCDYTALGRRQNTQ